jgi:hypothetical protein
LRSNLCIHPPFFDLIAAHPRARALFLTVKLAKISHRHAISPIKTDQKALLSLPEIPNRQPKNPNHALQCGETLFRCEQTLTSSS